MGLKYYNLGLHLDMKGTQNLYQQKRLLNELEKNRRHFSHRAGMSKGYQIIL